MPHLGDILRGMWQGRWVGLAVAWLGAAAFTALVLLIPDKYEATARVYVDTQSVLKPLLQGLTVGPNVEQEVTILSRTLISRPNLHKLVRMTDLDLAIKTNEQREKLIDDLTRRLYIKAVGPNLYLIGFAHSQPAQATRVVQSLLSIFVESGLSKGKDSGQARRFIEEQIKQYEQRLTEAEGRLKDFKLKNLDLNASEGRDFFASLATLNDSVQDARLLLQEAEKSRDALRQEMADADDRAPTLMSAPTDGAASAATPELDQRIATLNKSLDDMLLRYTENHPDVINTRRIVREAEANRDTERKRLAEEQEKRRRAAASPQSHSNPAYPQLRLAMAEAEAQVARMRARVREQEHRLAQLRAAARSVPEREAQLTQLNRDYSIQKQNYDALVARRESALISGDMEAATGVADFRIIDPPQVSPEPLAPSRKVLIPAALLAALLAGFGASYLFSMVQPKYHDIRGLKGSLARPVLGAVSLIWSPEVLKRRRLHAVAFFGGVGGLATFYGGILAFLFLRSLLN